MALTLDEIKVVLELSGRAYSPGKIQNKTGHSPTTIRKVINNAAEEAIKLKAKGLEVEQIANQLDYTRAFVVRTLKKYEDEQREKTKAEVETGGETDASEALKNSDTNKDYSEFQKMLGIEQCKDKIKREANGVIGNIRRRERKYLEEGVFDEAYDKRQKEIKKELEDFVLVKIDETDSMEVISDLERIYKDIAKQKDALFDQYDKKVRESKKLRRNYEEEQSDQLLDEKINKPLFPGFVRDYIKSNFVVRNEAEASIISNAMFEWVQFTDLMNKPAEYEEKMWKGFIILARDEGWDYLNNLAIENQKRIKELLLGMKVCPRCDIEFIVEHMRDKKIFRCPKCGDSYQSTS